MRRSLPALTDGALDAVATEYDENASWLVVRRGPVAITCNLSGAGADVPLDTGAAELLAASRPPQRAARGGVRLAPESAAIWWLRAPAST